MVNLSDIENKISNKASLGFYKVVNPTKPHHVKFTGCIGRPMLGFSTLYEDPKSHMALKFRYEDNPDGIVVPDDFGFDEIEEVTGIDVDDFWTSSQFVYPNLLPLYER